MVPSAFSVSSPVLLERIPQSHPEEGTEGEANVSDFLFKMSSDPLCNPSIVRLSMISKLDIVSTLNFELTAEN